MSDLKKFFKENKLQEDNKFYAPTKSLTDEKGEALMWEFKKLTARAVDDIRETFTTEVPVAGKPGMYRSKVRINAMNREMVVQSVVFPDLNNAQLQDSYNVKTSQDLLMEMVDDPGEFTKLVQFVSELNGFDLEDEVEEAKNL